MRLRLKRIPKALFGLLIIIILAGGFIFYYTQIAKADWFNASFPYRVKITIDHTKVPSDLTDFPVYVNLSQMPASFFQNVQADGGDIRVTSGDSLTEIPREVVAINTASSTGELYFKASTLSSATDTSFYIYYGNPSAVGYADNATYGAENVWSNGFAAVYHMNQANVVDSTANGNDGVATAGITQTDGKIGNAQSDAAATRVITIPDDNSLDIADNLTVTFWERFYSYGDYYSVNPVQKYGSTSDANFSVYVWGNYNGTNSSREGHITCYANVGGNWTSIVPYPGPALGPLNQWHSVTVSYGTVAGGKLYLDGRIAGEHTPQGVLATNSDPLRLNLNNSASDEVRISSVTRSADWISTSYANQNAPSTFYTVGSEVQALPSISTYNVTGTGTNTATVNGYITNTGSYTVTERGFVYSLSAKTDPGNTSPASSTYAYVKNETGSFSTGGYTMPLSALNSDTTYYIRAYAKNSAGYSYGAEQSFTTDNAPPTIATNATANSTTIATTTPTLKFTGTDPEGNDLTYEVQVNSTSSFSGGGSGGEKSFNVTIPSSEVSGSGTITDFPVYIDLADMPADFWNTVKSDGGDIRVYDASDNELPRQVVSINTTNQTGEVWVKTDLSPTSDTTLTLTVDGTSPSYAATSTYGGQNVWTNDAVATYHLTDGTDSSGNGLVATLENAPAPVPGELGGALSFDGVNQYLRINRGSGFSLTGAPYTISFYAKTMYQNYAGFPRVISWYDGNKSIEIGLNDNSSSEFGYYLGISGDTTSRVGSSLLSYDTWHRITVTYDGVSTYKMYIDGVENDSNASYYTGLVFYSSDSSYVYIGQRGNGRWYEGDLDGVRFSSAVRTPSWISTSYNNQSAPSSFYTITEQASGPLVDATSDTDSDADTGFSNTVTASDTDPFTSSDEIGYSVQSALNLGTTYYWRVRTKDPSGSDTWSSWSSTKSFDVADTPSSPNNLASDIKSESVKLTWTAPASDGGATVTDYEIQYQTSTGGTWTTFADGVGTSMTATVTGLSNDTSYDFRVRAVNAMGESAWSNVVSASPGEPAQVIIQSFPDTTASTIQTNIRITNEGTQEYEYQYTWCVTDSVSNLCGGGDDVFSASAAKLITAGANFDTTLDSTVNTAGSYVFHLVADYGSASSSAHQTFTVTVSTNNPPVAVDDAVTVSEDSQNQAFYVLSNDTDPENDTISIASTTDPVHGQASIYNPPGGPSSIWYTPDVDFSGTDTFTYTVSDGSATDVATVTVTVTAENDAPAISSVTDSPDPVIAGSSTTFSVNWSDADGDGVKTYICKTNAFASGSCTSGAWVKQDTSFSVTSPQTLSYTASSSDLGTNNYWAFVLGSNGSTSSSTAGSFTVSSSTSSGTDGGGTPSSNTIVAHVFIPTAISISVGSDVSLRPLSMSVNTAVGSTQWNVVTNNKSGYQLMVKASSNPALKNVTTSKSFADYSEAADGIPESWSVSNAYEFGFSAFGDDTSTGTWGSPVEFYPGDIICNHPGPSYYDPNTSDLKWLGFSGSTPITIAHSTAESTDPSGVDTTVCFATEQNGVFAPSGTYQATITVTAITN